MKKIQLFFQFKTFSNYVGVARHLEGFATKTKTKDFTFLFNQLFLWDGMMENIN